MDSSGLQVFVDELVKLFLFISIQGVDLAIKSGLCIGDQLDSMVPRLLVREFVEVLLGEQVIEGMVMRRYHLFKSLLQLVSVCSHSQFVCMMNSVDDQLFLHLDS